MHAKHNKIHDFVSLPEAAEIRNCSHQAISELVKKDRFTVYEISGHKYLSKKEVQDYKPATTGRPRKQEEA
ncbi:MAG TPA: hypothetical protein VF335_04680 [Chitinivibrionales bacterium]